MARSAIQMVPFGWSPSGANFSAQLGNLTSLLAFDTNIINQITNYLSTPASSVLDDLSRISAMSNLQNDFNRAKGLYEEITGIFDVSSFNISTNGDIIDNALNTGTDVLSRVENIIGKYDQIESLATDVVNHIEQGFNEVGNIVENVEDMALGTLKTIEGYADSITSTIENFSAQLGDLVNFDVSNTLNNLPDLVQNNIMNITIVSDGLLMLNDLQTSVLTISANLVNLKAPSSLASIRTLVTDIKGIMQQIQQVKDNAQRFYKSIEQLQSIATSGNYVNLLLSLAQGGVTFFEHPPTYAAKYPHNAGYRTHGGHIHEEDNTPGKERKLYQHPSGTQVAIHPEGATNIKSKNDIQASADGYIDMNSGADTTITVKGTARIIADTVFVESSSKTIISSAGTIKLSSSGTIDLVSSGDIRFNSLGTITLSGALGVEINTGALMTFSANTGINTITPGFVNYDVGTMWTEKVGVNKSVNIGGFSTENTVGYKKVQVGGYYDEKIVNSKSSDIGVSFVQNVGSTAFITAGGTYSVKSALIMLN